VDLIKIPKMKKAEYDQLISEEHVCRMAFKGDEHPYIAPFLYVFDGGFMYFLSTKYGKKIKYFQQDPHVSVEVERYEPDLSHYSFVTLRGKLTEITNSEEKRSIRRLFVGLIRKKNLSKNVLEALGHSNKDPLEAIVEKDRSRIWKLVDVKEIIGLKNTKQP